MIRALLGVAGILLVLIVIGVTNSGSSTTYHDKMNVDTAVALFMIAVMICQIMFSVIRNAIVQAAVTGIAFGVSLAIFFLASVSTVDPQEVKGLITFAAILVGIVSVLFTWGILESFIVEPDMSAIGGASGPRMSRRSPPMARRKSP